MMMEILTGNELLSGATVYLDPQGRWVDDLRTARVFGPDDKAAKDAALAATRATGRVLNLDAETVTVRDGIPVPTRIRERIRADGPTAPAFPRQSLGEVDHVSI